MTPSTSGKLTSWPGSADVRVFLAGGTGVIGPVLIDRLQASGHTVIALTRSDAKAKQLAAAGCEVARGDALDPETLKRAAVEARPEVIINQLTSLPKSLMNPIQANSDGKLTNQLRVLGAPALAAAARETGAKLIAQSIAFAQKPGSGIRKEDDPLYLTAPASHRSVIKAIGILEEATLAAGGVVLRYGHFYGPGTYFAPDGAYAVMLHKRMLPIVGQGRGSFHMLHLDDAAEATIKAIGAPTGVYNVTDDVRVTAGDLLPWMAREIGAPLPLRVPPITFALGPLTILRYLIDEQPAVSNQKAKDTLGWLPKYPDWHDPLAELLR